MPRQGSNLEPAESKSDVLPIAPRGSVNLLVLYMLCNIVSNILDAPLGLEPRLTESESALLPLEEGAIYHSSLKNTWGALAGFAVRCLFLLSCSQIMNVYNKMCGLHEHLHQVPALLCKSWYRLAFCWQAIYVVRHYGLDRLKRIIMSSTDKFFTPY